MNNKDTLKTNISIDALIEDIETRLNESIHEDELEEGALKNAALAAMLGLGTYAGFEATDMDNTPLAQAMEKAAEQGDEYAARELKNLTLYLDAGATGKIKKLSDKYLDSTKNEDITDEENITEKDEDDPCWDGYEQVGTKMKDGEEVPNCVPISEHMEESTGATDYNPKDQGGTRKELLAKYSKTKNSKDAEAARRAGATQKELKSALSGENVKEETLLVAMKDSAIAESIGMSTQEARNVLRNFYGYDDLAIARAQLDETTSAGSVATVSAPIGDTKKRSVFGEEEGNKDSEFDSMWFYKTVDGEVEGPYKSEKAATDAANNYADWIKQGGELEDTDRRLAKRAFLMRSSLSESELVSEYEKKFRSQLNESMDVSVNVDPNRPETRTISVSATEEDADNLAGLLANAGLFASPGYENVKFEPEHSTSDCGCGDKDDMPMEDETEHANSPDEKYQDMEYMLDVVSGGINRQKKSYDKAEDGDNPMDVVREEMDTAVGTMEEFYSYVLDFYGPNGIYDIGATEEEVKKATEIVKNEVGDDFEGDTVDREKVRDVILDQMRSEEERKEAEKAFRPKASDEVDPDFGNNVPDPIQTRADVDYDFDSMRNFNETDEVKRLAGLS